MNVFMTGANGFVGLNIVNALVAAGHCVTAYARAGPLATRAATGATCRR